MPASILFFPPSMPDETIQSRITRYHTLSGNRTEHETFKDIFGTPRFVMRIVPSKLGDLASRLPGDEKSNLDELLKFNTILPVYRPFLGISSTGNLEAEGSMAALARIPRREVGTHSMAKICLECIRDDLSEQGYSYWHRAHHIPGVTTCWRHGESLIQACPQCSHPFYRREKLLPSLASGCVCGWNPTLSQTREPGLQIERDIAVFAKDLLERNLPAIKSDVLVACYSRRARDLGYSHGQFISRQKLFESIQSKFGDEVLSKMDNAYALGKHNQWIRTTTINGLLDMPITRHLILTFHLFKTVDDFERRLISESLAHNVVVEKAVPVLKDSNANKRKFHRQKVTTLISARPTITIDYLWTHAYQATLWLTTHDKRWLNAVLSGENNRTPNPEFTPDKKDEEYSKIIVSGVESIYLITPRQVRANLSNMMALLPKKLPVSVQHRKSLFPLVSRQLELNYESNWHFILRRTIWGLSEMARLNLAPNGTSVALLTSVPANAWKGLVEHFEWNLEQLVKAPVDPERLLKETGVNRQWLGPPGYKGAFGGRSYVSVKSVKSAACYSFVE